MPRSTKNIPLRSVGKSKRTSCDDGKIVSRLESVTVYGRFVQNETTGKWSFENAHIDKGPTTGITATFTFNGSSHTFTITTNSQNIDLTEWSTEFGGPITIIPMENGVARNDSVRRTYKEGKVSSEDVITIYRVENESFSETIQPVVDYVLEIRPKATRRTRAAGDITIPATGSTAFTAHYIQKVNGTIVKEEDVTSAAVWYSTNKNAATVGQGENGGKVTGKNTSTTKTASTEIYATYKTKSSNRITVNVEALKTTKEYFLSGPTFISAIGTATLTLYCRIKDELGNVISTNRVTSGIVWSSSDTNLATVDSNGQVTGHNTGETQQNVTISAVIEGQTSTFELTLGPANYEYEIKITPENVTIRYTGQTQLTAICYEFINGVQHSMTDVTSAATWTTSNVGIASVVKGKVTGSNDSASEDKKVTITAEYNGSAGKSTITVQKAPVADAFDFEKTSFNYCTIDSPNTGEEFVNFTSNTEWVLASDEDWISIYSDTAGTDNGQLNMAVDFWTTWQSEGKSVGDKRVGHITATYGSPGLSKKTKQITITQWVESRECSFTLSGPSQIFYGETKTITPTAKTKYIYPGAPANAGVKDDDVLGCIDNWSSNNPTITVSQEGKITGNNSTESDVSVTITATYTGFFGQVDKPEPTTVSSSITIVSKAQGSIEPTDLEVTIDRSTFNGSGGTANIRIKCDADVKWDMGLRAMWEDFVHENKEYWRNCEDWGRLGSSHGTGSRNVTLTIYEYRPGPGVTEPRKERLYIYPESAPEKAIYITIIQYPKENVNYRFVTGLKEQDDNSEISLTALQRYNDVGAISLYADDELLKKFSSASNFEYKLENGSDVAKVNVLDTTLDVYGQNSSTTETGQAKLKTQYLGQTGETFLNIDKYTPQTGGQGLTYHLLTAATSSLFIGLHQKKEVKVFFATALDRKILSLEDVTQQCSFVVSGKSYTDEKALRITADKKIEGYNTYRTGYFSNEVQIKFVRGGKTYTGHTDFTSYNSAFTSTSKLVIAGYLENESKKFYPCSKFNIGATGSKSLRCGYQDELYWDDRIEQAEAKAFELVTITPPVPDYPIIYEGYARNIGITWASSDPNVLSVNEDGVITANNTDTTNSKEVTITATHPCLGTAEVTVIVNKSGDTNVKEVKMGNNSTGETKNGLLEASMILYNYDLNNFGWPSSRETSGPIGRWDDVTSATTWEVRPTKDFEVLSDTNIILHKNRNARRGFIKGTYDGFEIEQLFEVLSTTDNKDVVEFFIPENRAISPVPTQVTAIHFVSNEQNVTATNVTNEMRDWSLDYFYDDPDNPPFSDYATIDNTGKITGKIFSGVTQYGKIKAKYNGQEITKRVNIGDRYPWAGTETQNPYRRLNHIEVTPSAATIENDGELEINAKYFSYALDNTTFEFDENMIDVSALNDCKWISSDESIAIVEVEGGVAKVRSTSFDAEDKPVTISALYDDTYLASANFIVKKCEDMPSDYDNPGEPDHDAYRGYTMAPGRNLWVLTGTDVTLKTWFDPGYNYSTKWGKNTVGTWKVHPQDGDTAVTIHCDTTGQVLVNLQLWSGGTKKYDDYFRVNFVSSLEKELHLWVFPSGFTLPLLSGYTMPANGEHQYVAELVNYLDGRAIAPVTSCTEFCNWSYDRHPNPPGPIPPITIGNGESQLKPKGFVVSNNRYRSRETLDIVATYTNGPTTLTATSKLNILPGTGTPAVVTYSLELCADTSTLRSVDETNIHAFQRRYEDGLLVQTTDVTSSSQFASYQNDVLSINNGVVSAHNSTQRDENVVVAGLYSFMDTYSSGTQQTLTGTTIISVEAAP